MFHRILSSLLTSTIILATGCAETSDVLPLGDEGVEASHLRSLDPDLQLTDDLASIADEFGDASGQIRTVDAAGQTKVLVRDLRSPEVFTSGDVVYGGDQLGVCVEDANGRLSACEELVAPPDPEVFFCSDPTCWCTDPWDCTSMARDKICFDWLTCEQGKCICQPSEP